MERWPRAPWTYPLTDLRPQGPAEHETFTGEDLILWLYVRGVAEPWWLAVRMTAAGQWLIHIPTDSTID
mgnify:CR=1 FL=1